MTIKQSWSTIGVEFETDRTCSHSVGAFMTMDAAHLVLTIEYRADFRVLHQEDRTYRLIAAHPGTAPVSQLRDAISTRSRCRTTRIIERLASFSLRSSECRLALVPIGRARRT